MLAAAAADSSNSCGLSTFHKKERPQLSVRPSESTDRVLFESFVQLPSDLTVIVQSVLCVRRLKSLQHIKYSFPSHCPTSPFQRKRGARLWWTRPRLLMLMMLRPGPGPGPGVRVAGVLSAFLVVSLRLLALLPSPSVSALRLDLSSSRAELRATDAVLKPQQPEQAEATVTSSRALTREILQLSAVLAAPADAKLAHSSADLVAELNSATATASAEADFRRVIPDKIGAPRISASNSSVANATSNSHPSSRDQSSRDAFPPYPRNLSQQARFHTILWQLCVYFKL